MTRAEILETLLGVGRAVLDEEELSFDERTSFEEIASWDSSNHLRRVVRMEATLGIRFENSDLLRLKVVGDLVSVIERRQAEARSAG
jgi:acyl carrier protein